VGWAAHFFVALTGESPPGLAFFFMISNELRDLVAPELEALGFECVKLEVVGSAGSPVVRLYIDKPPDGVSIGDCSLVSRTISLVLEKADPFPGRYLLEVSSPGNNRPLVTEAHFRRFQGEAAKVQAMVGAEKKTYRGTIQTCSDGLVTLLTEDSDSVQIRLSDIINASLTGQEYRIDKKTNRPKRKKRDGHSARTKRGGNAKGDDQ
jgi:ribosome maturation factor RimP